MGKKMRSKSTYFYYSWMLILAMSLYFPGCVKDNSAGAYFLDKKVFYASTENDNVKTVLGRNHDVLWQTGDKISVFAGTDENLCFDLASEPGQNDATFHFAKNSISPAKAKSFDANYAMYPYSPDTKFNNGDIEFSFPEELNFERSGFAQGCSPMVAVTPSLDSDIFYFSNLCGILKFRLKGVGNVCSLILEGGNGEILSGAGIIKAVFGEEPSVTMNPDGSKHISIACGNYGIPLSPNNITDFYFVIPPTSFKDGLTIKVIADDGSFMTCSTDKEINIRRNMIESMDPVIYRPTYNDGYVHFRDDIFKEYCLGLFDYDKDGNISVDDAEKITALDICTSEIQSFEGINYFKNLEHLSIYGERVESGSGGLIIVASEDDLYLDLPKLKELDIYGGFKSIDISNCSNLSFLSIRDTHIKSIDLSGNPYLETIDANSSTLESIDISSLKRLKNLDLQFNWDLVDFKYSYLPDLESLMLSYSKLTSLDLSMFPNLTFLRLYSWEKFPELDVTMLHKLSTLQCILGLKSIDLSGCPLLKEVMIGGQNKPLEYIIMNVGQKPDSFEYESNTRIFYTDDLFIEESDYYANGYKGSLFIDALSISDIMVSEKPDWITVGDIKQNDKISYTIGLIVSPNSKGSDRTGNITISNKEGKSHSITVFQGAVTDARDWTKTEFLQRSLISKFTATWCQYCPNVESAVRLAQKRNPDAIEVMNIHNSDEFAIEADNTLEAQYYVSSYPTYFLNWGARLNILSTPEEMADNILSNIEQHQKTHSANSGISMVSRISSNKLDVDVNIYVKHAGDYKISVALLEDGIISGQSGQELDNYTHYNTLRAFLSDYDGQQFTVSSDYSVKNMKFSGIIPETCNRSNLKILVYIQCKSGFSWEVDNCLSAKIGEDVSLQLANGTTGDGNEEIVIGEDIKF